MSRGRVARPLEQRMAERIAVTDDGCWDWIGARSAAGYGQVREGGPGGGALLYVHRVVYALLVGPIPAGLELDHLCRRPSCCNPEHLEPVAHRENMRRAPRIREQLARRHCPHGHALDGQRSDGRRYCRRCSRARMARHRSRELLEP